MINNYNIDISNKKKMKKILLIKELKKDNIVNDIFVVKFKKPVEPYKNGFKFELRLGDSSGEIMFKYWGSMNEVKVNQLYDKIRKDDVVFVQGRVNEWNNALEIAANDNNEIKVLDNSEYNASEFIKHTEKDIETMWNDLIKITDTIKDPEISALVDYFVKDEGFAEKFKKHPAAMYKHHGWIGGLLEHTLIVIGNVLHVHKNYPQLNRDLLIAGALFHDIGKINELEVKSSIKMSTEGMLVGHVNIAIEWLSKAMEELKISEILKIKMIHMIMTHMGEYGSNKLPSFPEALVVFYSDQMDANLVTMLVLMKDARTEDDYIYQKDFGNIYLK